MILTASDVSELSNALSWWERGEYFFSFVVAAACFGEYVADFKPRWYRTGDAECDEKRKGSISKISTLVLVAALVFELVCVVRSNALAGEVIGSINNLATNAAGQAKTALDNAGSAQKLAQTASDTAGPAKATADDAKGKADAVSEKADALKVRIANLNKQVDADSPRSVVLSNVENDLIKKASPFAGQRVVIQTCGPLLSSASPPYMNAEKREQDDTWANLGHILIDEAKWAGPSPGLNPYSSWEKCAGMWGVQVIVNVGAPSKTIQAARILSDELTNVLPPQPLQVLELSPDDLGLPPIDQESAWTLLSKDHGLIAVVIAEKPTPTSRNIPKTSKKKNR